jgi:hypothetical protein
VAEGKQGESFRLKSQPRRFEAGFLVSVLEISTQIFIAENGWEVVATIQSPKNKYHGSSFYACP